MRFLTCLSALGLDAGAVDRARAQGHVIGRGEGFVTREWKAPSGVTLAVHLDPAEKEIQEVVPFVSGLGRDVWELVAVYEGKASPHESIAKLRRGGAEVVALVPDFSARRKMFPVGLDVQASVLVVAEEWREGAEFPALSTRVEDDPAGACVVCGKVVELRDGEVRAARIGSDAASVWVAGRLPERIEVGAEATVSGRAIVRIGAPTKPRGIVERS